MRQPERTRMGASSHPSAWVWGTLLLGVLLSTVAAAGPPAAVPAITTSADPLPSAARGRIGLASAPDLPAAGLRFWLDAARNVFTDADGLVLKWVDLGPGSLPVVQTDAARRPLWVTNVLAGRPAVRFDGVNDSLYSLFAGTNLFGPTSTTIFLVQRQPSTDIYGTTLTWTYFEQTNRVNLHLAYGGKLLFDFGDATTGGRISALAPDGWGDRFHEVEALREPGGQAAIGVDGFELVRGPLAGSLDVQHVGFLILGGQEPALLAGDLAEVLIYDSALGVEERQQVRRYLGGKYGLDVSGNYPPVVSLPSPADHDAYASTDTVLLRADASDVDGLVSRVEFFVEGDKVGEVTQPPYELQWPAARVGISRVWARATDDGGKATESPVARIVVLAGPPFPVRGLGLWLDADQGVTPDEQGLVRLWQDRTGWDRVAGQADTNRRPQWITAGLNGHATVRFDGSNDGLVAPIRGADLFSSNATTIFVVQRQTATNALNATLAWNVFNPTNRVNLHLAYNDLLLFDFGNPSAGGRLSGSAPAGWGDAFHVVEALREEAGFGAVSVDGFARARAPMLGQLAPGLTGDLTLGGVEPARLNGEIAELLIFRRSLSAEERRQVRRYLGDKFGLDASGNLPPSVTLQRPVDLALVAEGDAIDLAAVASDSDGAVARVAFYGDGALIGESVAAPFSLVWRGASLGRHELNARAVDNEGKSADSDPIEVWVLPGGTIPLDGLTLWLDASQGVETADGVVQAWRDAARGLLRLSQEAPTSRPQLVAAAVNGRPAISFDGVEDRLATRVAGGALFGTNAATIYVVQRQASGHDGNTTFTWQPFGSKTRVNLHLAHYGRVYFDFGDPAQGGRLAGDKPPWWEDQFHVIEAGRDGAVGWLWAESQDLARGAFTGPLENNPLGDLLLGGAGDAYLKGELAELIVYNRALSDLEREGVRDYLGAKYGLIVRPNQLPDVRFTAPAAGAVFRIGTELQVSVVATDPDGQIVRVELDGALVGQPPALLGRKNSPPFDFAWQPSQTGDYLLGAVATDDRGGQSAAATLQVTVLPPNQPPRVNLLRPLAGDALYAGAPIPLEAEAADADGGVARVLFLDGDQVIGEVTAPPFRLDWTGAAPGLHTLKVQAVDNEGASGLSAATAVSLYDGAETPLRGLRLWLDAARGVVTNLEGRVAAWGDRGPYFTPLRQDEAGRQPQWVADALNHQPAVRFDGADDELATLTPGGYLLGATEFTVFVVQRQNSANPFNTTLAWNSAAATNRVRLKLAYDANLAVEFGDATGAGALTGLAPAGWEDNYHVVECWREGAGTAAVWVDGAAVQQGQLSGALRTNVWASLRLGGIEDAHLQGEIAELLVYNRALSAEERTQARTYLGTRYGLDTTGQPRPTVSLVSPAAEEAVQLGESVRLIAEAAAATGPVARVEFFADGQLVGAASRSPFEFAWSGAALGEHRLIARAIGQSGPPGESRPVRIMVVERKEIPVNGLTLWLDAGRGVEAGGDGLVSGWRDKLGRAIGLAQTDPARQPRLGGVTLNGSPLVSFDGQADVLAARVDGRFLLSPNAATIYVVQRQNPAHGENTTLTWQAPGASNRVNLHLAHNGRLYFDFGDGLHGGRVAVAQPAWWDAGYHVVEAFRNGDLGWLWVDGVELGRGQFQGNLDTARKGDLLLGGISSGYLAGEVAEVIIYNRALASPEREVVREFLGAKYALPVRPNLPPTAAFSAPAPGAQFKAANSVRFVVAASDPEGDATTVKLYTARAGGAFSLFSEQPGPPYEFVWVAAVAGDYSFKAVATDRRGGQGQSAILTLRITPPNRPPLAQLLAPTADSGLQAGGAIRLTAQATDADGRVVSVSFYDTDVLLGRVTQPPYELIWVGAAAGLHYVSVAAEDDEGALGRSLAVELPVYDPAEIPVPGLRLWLDAGQGVLTDPQGLVGVWRDRTPFGRELAQADAPARPRLLAADLNGRPALQFDGLIDVLTARVAGTNLFGSDAATIYIVQRQHAAHAQNSSLTWQAPGLTNRVNLHLAYFGRLYFDYGDATAGGRLAVEQPAWWPAAYHVVEATRAGSTGALWAEGEQLLQGQFTGTLATTAVGELSLGGTGTGYLEGEIAEVIVYNRALAEPERATVRSYLGTKYALQIQPNQPPTVSFVAPPPDSKFRVLSLVALRVQAADLAGQVVSVRFYATRAGNPQKLLGELKAAPYDFSWLAAQPGHYTLEAVAVDNRGLLSPPAAVQVDILGANQTPQLSWLAPTPDAGYRPGEEISLEVNAADPDGTIAAVEFLDQGLSLGRVTTPPFRLAWRDAAAGLHHLVARATDNEGGVGSSGVLDLPVYAASALPVQGLSLWLDASQGVETGDDGLVALWHDLTPFQHDVGQDTPESRPRLAPAALNGWPVLRFDGTNDVLTSQINGQSLVGADEATLYVVQKQVGAHRLNTTFTWLSPDGVNRVNLHLAYNGNLFFDFGDAGVGGRLSAHQPQGWWEDAYHIVEAFRGGEAGSLWVSGDELSRGAFSVRLDNRPTGNLTIGGLRSAFLQGDMAEIIVYRRGLADAERQQVRAYLGAKYNLQVTPNQPPTVVFTAPAAGVSVRQGALVRVRVEGSDSDGVVTGLKLFAGTELIGQAGGPASEFLWRPAGQGSVTLSATATDNRGAQSAPASMAITVLPPNQPPLAQLLEPVAGATVGVGEVVRLAASAVDADGSVAQVVFYDGDEVIGAVNTPPYEFNWRNATPGVHQLAAVALDNEGASGQSPVTELPVYAAGGIPLAGLRLWLDAASGVETNSTGGVTRWRDGTPYALELTPARLTAPPAWASPGAGLPAVVRFDGGDNFLSARVNGRQLFGTNAATVYVVQRQASGHPLNTSVTWLASDLNTRVNLHLAYAGRLFFDFGSLAAGGRLTFLAPPGWEEAFHLVEAYRNDQSGWLWVDGREIGRGLFGSVIAADLSGALNIGGVGGAVLKGDVAEVIVYNRALEASELLAVRAYLGLKYGLYNPPNDPPTVALTRPAGGESFFAGAAIPLRAEAADPDGTVAEVAFYANGVLAARATTLPFAADWAPPGPGSYDLVAVVSDNRGAQASSAVVTIVVRPGAEAISVWLFEPSAEQVFAAPAQIPLRAGAASSLGAITNLEFYADASLVGGALTPPYALVWSNVMAGTYSLAARAYDESGASAVSDPRLVRVAPAIRGAVIRADGRLEFTFYGEPGQSYMVETSVDLAAWTPLTALELTQGVAAFRETSAAIGRARFYRVRAVQ